LNVDVLFCPDCDNLMHQVTFGDKITLSCRICGATKFLKVKDVPKKKEKIEEDYDFRNKTVSRKIVKRYIEELNKHKMTKTYRNQRVLILTHVKALDIKQILLPLGYRKKNIYIVEREKEIFDTMKNDPFFNECRLICKDLVDYKVNTKFDLVYLDFKSNISYDVLSIIRRLLLHNSHSGTIFYINVQMARETNKIVDDFLELENKLISNYEKEIEKECKKAKGIDEMEKHAMKVIDSFKTIKNKYNPSNAKDKLQIEINNKKITATPFSDDLDGIAEKIKDSFMKERRDLKLRKYEEHVKNRKNYHILRQKTLELYIKTCLNVFIENQEKFSELYNNPNKKSVDVDLDISPVKKIQRESQNIIRYLSKSFVPFGLKQFIYKNKNGIPFLNTVFILKNEQEIMRMTGFANPFDIITFTLLNVYIRYKGLVSDKQICYTLEKFLTQKMAFLKIEDNNVTKNPRKTLKTINKEVINATRTILNEIKKIYKDLRNSKILTFTNDSMLLRLFDSNIKPITLSGCTTEQLKLMKILKGEKIDVSIYLCSFYFLLKILEIIEEDFSKNIALYECDVMDIPDNKDIDEYVVENFFFKVKELSVIKSLKKYHKFLTSLIDFSLSMKKNLLKIGNKNVGPWELDEFYDRVVVSIKNLLKLKKKKKKLLNKNELKEMAFSLIEKYPNKKSVEISKILNDEVEKQCGYNPKISDCSVRAYKYWYKQGKEREVVTN